MKSFEQLKELILLEDFKSYLAESLVVHLNEQKIDTLSKAAIFADKFVLTHKVAFGPPLYWNYVSACLSKPVRKTF